MEGLFWFVVFWVALPALAYQGWGGWPMAGWPGVVLLLVLYAVGVVVVRAVVGAGR